MIDLPLCLAAARETSPDLLARAASLFDQGAHVEGERCAREALADAVAAADRDGQRGAWDLIALHADRLGRMAVAASAAEEALGLLAADAMGARARLHCRLARSFAVLELDAPNLRHATAAVACARACGDAELISLSLSRLGGARAATGDWKQAVELIAEALVLARNEGDGLEACRALNNLAAVYYYIVLDAARRGDRAAATKAGLEGLRFADEAMTHPATLVDPFLTLVARVNRNLLLVHSGHAAEALADSAEASEIAQRHGYREVALQLAYAHGKATVLLGDRAKGIALLEATLRTTAVEEPLMRTRLNEELYLLRKADGEFEKALSHHEALLALEQARSARRARAEYGVLRERAEVQRTRVLAERALRDAETERRRATRMQDERDEMEAHAAEMGRRALEDALTGMPNRRHVEAAMRTILAEAGGPQGTVCIGIIDIDHFKRVNDTFGHGVGDDVIRTVGKLLTAHLRAVDVVGRFGGEEFVFVLSRTSSDEATRTARRLRRAIERHEWHLLRVGLGVTVSIGVTLADAPCDPHLALDHADAALYAAKAAGRNRVIFEPQVDVQAGITAVASISTFARSSINATTWTADIAGK